MRARLLLLAGLLVLPAPLLVLPSSAVDYTVPCTGDPGTDGQALAQAIQAGEQTGTDDTVVLTDDCVYESPTTLVVSGRQVTLTTQSRAARITRSGVGPVFDVLADGRLVAERLIVDGGDGRLTSDGPGGPGGIDVRGQLVLSDSEVRNAQGDDGGAIRVGGEVDGPVTGQATLLRTAVYASSSASAGVAVLNRGDTTLVDTTVSIANGRDGALTADKPGSRLALHHTTVVVAGGVALQQTAGALVASGSVVTGGGAACTGAVTANGPNHADDASCGFTGAGDPRLLPFGPYAGGVLTAPPGPGSPLIDAGDPEICGRTAGDSAIPYAGPSDARGFPRSNGTCDLGASEASGTLSLSALETFDGTGTQDLVLTAGGLEATRLADPPAPGMGFAVDSTTCPAVLAVDQQCAYRLSWTPGENDAATSELRLQDNAGGPRRVLALDGERAAAPAPSPSPTASPTVSPTASPTPSLTATSPSPSPSTSPTPLPTQTSNPSPTPSASATASATPSPSGAVVVPPGPSSSSTASPRPVTSPDLRRVSRTDPVSWRVRHADQEVPWFVRNLRTPSEVDLSVGAVARSSLLALLLLTLLGLPVSIVNKTLVGHRTVLAAWLAPWRRRLPRLRTDGFSQPTLLMGAAVTTALVSTFLDPGAGFDEVTSLSFGALLVTILVTTAVNRTSDEVWFFRRYRVTPRTVVYPGFWVLAVACVVLSRLAGLSPGIVLGSLAGIQVARALSQTESAQKILFRLGISTAVALYAWALYGPLAREAQATHDTTTELFAAVTAALFVGGVGGTLLNLVPVGPLDGATLLRWSPRVWAGVTFVALFGFVHVLLHADRTDPLLDRPGYLGVLLATYVVVCAAIVAAFWVHDRRHPGVVLDTAPRGDGAGRADVAAVGAVDAVDSVYEEDL